MVRGLKVNHKKLKERVEAVGLKQTWLATQLGINIRTLNAILNGRMAPSLAVYKVLCDLIDSNESDFLLESAS